MNDKVMPAVFVGHGSPMDANFSTLAHKRATSSDFREFGSISMTSYIFE